MKRHLQAGLKGRPRAQTQTEGFLARMAADFPDLIDPKCIRAKRLPTERRELFDWLRRELKLYVEAGLKENEPGTVARVGKLLLDRAHAGFPESSYVKA